MKKILLGLLLFAAVILVYDNSYSAARKYYVYCVKDKVVIDTHNLKEMQSSHGKDVSKLKEFTFMLDAEAYAKKIGGVGAACPKK